MNSMKNSPHEGFDEIKNIADTEKLWKDEEEEENPNCRFCWVAEHTPDNPIFRSCNCSGSIKYIHFQWIKAWLASRVTTKGEETHTTLTWKQFECELCKMPYPYWFKFKGKRWNLVDLKRPDDDNTPYIILESLNSEKNTSRTIHTVTIKSDKKQFQLGRGHESDLRINDISVSRRHACIEYRNDGFYLVDFKSKFGTLVLQSHNVEVPEHSNQNVQIGRTIVTTRPKLKSEIPSYINNESNLIPDQVYQASNDEVKFDEEYKNGEYKVIQINGKRYLVKPENEIEDQSKYSLKIYPKFLKKSTIFLIYF